MSHLKSSNSRSSRNAIGTRDTSAPSTGSTAGSANASTREIETMLLMQHHGDDPEAAAKITKILSERYSLTGAQKPFLMLEGTEMREDVKESLQEKIREKNKKESQRKDALRKTLKTTRKNTADSGVHKIPNTKGKAKIRHSRLEHARHGLNQYIQDCKNSQTQLELKLKNISKRNPNKEPTSDESSELSSSISYHLDPQVLQYKYKIPMIQQFQQLNELWEGYMRELLFTSPDEANTQRTNVGCMTLQYKLGLAGKLASADYHGARLKVVSAHNPSLVGTEGIVIWEAKSSFVMVVSQKDCTLDNATIREKIGGLRIIEKRGSVFTFDVRINAPGSDTARNDEGGAANDCGKVNMKMMNKNQEKENLNAQHETMTFEIVGSRFLYRTAERSGKKFKSRSIEDLL